MSKLLAFILFLATSLFAEDKQISFSPEHTNTNNANLNEQLLINAENGDADAQAILGRCYYNGEGVAQNKVEAVKWFQKATEQGHAASQVMLGMCYFNGEGIHKNQSEGVKLIHAAAEKGVASAQWLYAELYRFGPEDSSSPVSKNMAESVKWYRRAAEQGFAKAQAGLGGLYFLGDGVPKDYVEAYKWLNLALAQGNGIAKEAFTSFERPISFRLSFLGTNALVNICAFAI